MCEHCGIDPESVNNKMDKLVEFASQRSDVYMDMLTKRQEQYSEQIVLEVDDKAKELGLPSESGLYALLAVAVKAGQIKPGEALSIGLAVLTNKLKFN